MNDRSLRYVHVSARAAACLLASFALVSCTARQSTDQYEARLTHAQDVQSDVARALQAGEYEDEDAYLAASERVGEALVELDSDAPPGNVQAAHDRMVEAMDGLAILLDRLARCERRIEASEQDRRACHQAIGQDVYDEIRNDFDEANTIYGQEGLPTIGGEGEDDTADQLPEGSDQLGEDPGGGAER